MNEFSYHGNYVICEDNDRCYAAFLYDDRKKVSKNWPIVPKIQFKVAQVLGHETYHFEIIDGSFPKENLPFFKEYMKKLDEALTILYGAEYEECKVYMTICHKIQCMEEDEKGVLT